MRFLTTYQISGEIENILRSADERILLVTPYVLMRDNYVERLRYAQNNGIEIHFVFRKTQLEKNEVKKIESIDKINLYYLENLHAKCYMNEKSAIITSMNLYEYSENNNREMGLIVDRKSHNEVFSEIE